MDGRCACDGGCVVLSRRQKGRVTSTPRKLTPTKASPGRCRVRVNVALEGEGLAPQKLELPLHEDCLRRAGVGQATVGAATTKSLRMTIAYSKQIISFLETRQPAEPSTDTPGMSSATAAQYTRMPAWAHVYTSVHWHPCKCVRARECSHPRAWAELARGFRRTLSPSLWHTCERQYQQRCSSKTRPPPHTHTRARARARARARSRLCAHALHDRLLLLSAILHMS